MYGGYVPSKSKSKFNYMGTVGFWLVTCIPDKVNSELIEWEKLFAMFKADKVLRSGIHKKFLQENSNLDRKKIKRRNHQNKKIFMEKVTLSIWKICTSSLVTRETERAETSHFIPGRLAETRQPADDVTCRWDVGK